MDRSEVLEVTVRWEAPRRDHAGGSGTPAGHSSANIQYVTRIPLIESHTGLSADSLTFQSWKLARYTIGLVVKEDLLAGPRQAFGAPDPHASIVGGGGGDGQPVAKRRAGQFAVSS